MTLVTCAIAAACSPSFADSVFAKVKLPQQTIASTSNPKQIDLKALFQVHPAPGPILTIEFSAPEVDGYRDVLVDTMGLQPEYRMTYRTSQTSPYSNLYEVFSDDLIWADHTLEFQLWPDSAPTNVANFLSYVAAGHYNRTIIHRMRGSKPGESREPALEFLQAGAVRKPESQTVSNQLPWIPQFSSVPLETAASHSEGSLAMARPEAHPDSATNQFFINTTDNSHSFDGKYSVIGELISGNIQVLRELTQANTFNLSDNPETNFWSAFPLFTPFWDDPLSYLSFDSFKISEPTAFAENYTWKFVEAEDDFQLQTEEPFAISISDEGILSIRSKGRGNALLEVSATDSLGRSHSVVFPLLGIRADWLENFPQSDSIGAVYEAGAFLDLDDLGRSLVYRVQQEKFMIYTDPVGWLWTDPSTYPWLYSITHQTWLYLYPTLSSNQQRWVFSPEGIQGNVWLSLESLQ